MANPLVFGSTLTGIASDRYVRTSPMRLTERPVRAAPASRFVPEGVKLSREALRSSAIESSRRLRTRITRASEEEITGPKPDSTLPEGDITVEETRNVSRRTLPGASGRTGTGGAHRIDLTARNRAGINDLQRFGASAYRQESHALVGNYFNLVH